MKRIRAAALLLSFALFFSACGKQPTDEKRGSMSSDSSSETSEESNDKATKQVSMNIDDLVSEMEESKGQNYHYPVLNESQLGERAKKFNQTIRQIYKDATEYNLNDLEPEVFGEPIQYFPYIDSERQIFSILFQYVEQKGYYVYETAVFDLKDPDREVPLAEALKMFDWEPKQLRDRVEQYFKNVYALDSRDFTGNLEPKSDAPVMDYDKFLNNRMKKYDTEVQEGMPFTIDEEGLTVYFTTSYPTLMETHTERYRVKKNVVDDLFANETFGSMMAIINHVTDEERAKLNIVDEYRQGSDDGLTQEKIFVALKDDVDFDLTKLKSNTTYPTDTVYQRRLKKGEAVSVHVIIPEGMPNLRASGEILPEGQEVKNPEDAALLFIYFFMYDKMLDDIKIEFIDGEFAYG